MRQLSKSEFMMFLKHPAWAWLKKHDKNKLPKPDDNLQARFDAGEDFESYAEQRFPDGVRLGFDGFDEYAGLTKKTTQALKSDAPAVFQGRIEADRLTCIFDILKRVDGTTFDLYEVKSSTKVKPEHIYDLAFQYITLERAGIHIRNIYIIHVNRDYVREGDVDPVALSTITDVSDKVRKEIDMTEVRINKALKTIDSTVMPDISPRFARLGALNEWLDIYRTLRSDIPPYSIYDLIAPGAKRIGELEDQDIERITDIPDEADLTPKQQRQVAAVKRDERIIDKERIKTFLDALIYPLYFLDYEAVSGVVPFYDGTRPYQHVPFQYSLHTITEPGAEPVHTEYLHTDDTNPVPPLLTKLSDDVGETGSVIVWHKQFETRCNSQMADTCPDYQQFLENVNERVVDLKDPFAEGWFIDKDFNGSASIKNVLPVLAPHLTYKTLGIQDGETASRLWMEAVLTHKKGVDKKTVLDDLLQYCALDTLAMVEIWRALHDAIA